MIVVYSAFVDNEIIPGGGHASIAFTGLQEPFYISWVRTEGSTSRFDKFKSRHDWKTYYRVEIPTEEDGNAGCRIKEYRAQQDWQKICAEGRTYATKWGKEVPREVGGANNYKFLYSVYNCVEITVRLLAATGAYGTGWWTPTKFVSGVAKDAKAIRQEMLGLGYATSAAPNGFMAEDGKAGNNILP